MIQRVAVAAAAFCLCSIGPAARAADVVEQKIATVNLQKVFDKYYKTARMQSGLEQEAEDLQKQRQSMVESAKKLDTGWQKLFDRANDQAISTEERARLKQMADDKLREIKTAERALQEFDRAGTARLDEKKRQRHDDLLMEIRNVLIADAKAGGYTLVLDVSGDSLNTVPVALYTTGVNDLTTNLITELNANAPAAPADEKYLTEKPKPAH
jgi:outer membrane protein